MKKILIIICLTSLCSYLFSAPTDTIKSLKIGQNMPNIPLGNMLNNPGKESAYLKGKKTWNDLRGKIIILDFWMTTCGSCIDGFPKMSKLQEQFKDQVEIFLVNPYESKEKISRWVKNKKRSGQNILPDNLTMLFSKELDQLFPTTYATGFHVWLDKNGTVVLRGICENTNAEKLQQFINGDAVSFIKDSPPLLDLSERSLIKIPEKPASFNSYFGGFNADFGGPYGYGKRNIIDSVSATIRDTYINIEGENIIKFAYDLEFKKDKNILLGNHYILEEPLLISQNPKYYNTYFDDKIIRQSRFCYEQILPIQTPDSLREKMMQDDLNKYFYQILGIKAFFANKSRQCFKLIRIKEIMPAPANATQKTVKKIGPTGSRIIEHQNAFVFDFFASYFDSLDKDIFGVVDPLVIDDTGFKGKTTIILPSYEVGPNNLEELRLELRKNGFDLVYGKSTLRTLVVGKPE